MKKVLMIATYGDFFAAFETSNIRILNDLGYEVHLCANWNNPKYNYKHENLSGLKFKKIHIPFERKPYSLKNLKCFFYLIKVLKREKYFLMDCHNAVVGIYSRIAAKLTKVPKTMYTAHGFQFFKNGSILNWILYYPLEYVCSILTDIIVVINKDDLEICEKFKNKKTYYIPGVGFEYQKYSQKKDSKIKKRLRDELSITSEEFVILSVGELSSRKNQETIIRAVFKIKKNENLRYLIIGQGKKEKKLKKLVRKLNLNKQVMFLGHRNDIENLNSIADLAVFPSKREGLGIAALESMASGLPLITSNVQGIKDYSINNYTGYSFDPKNIEGYVDAIELLMKNTKKRKELGSNAQKISKNFDIKNVEKKMIKIYENIEMDEI